MNTAHRSLVAALTAHSRSDPDRRAFVFLSPDGSEEMVLTFGELCCRARLLSKEIRNSTKSGDRVLLAFPPGLEFVVAFIGCLYAGAIAVPVVLPRRNRVLDATRSIIADCDPKLAMTTVPQGPPLKLIFEESLGIDYLPILTVDLTQSQARVPVHLGSEDICDIDEIAFLQYTSGSTSTPKGVVVSHGNLSANLEMITDAYKLDRSSTRVGWIPLHHDMGLIFNVLQACYCGALCVLMAPMSYLKQPLLWLRAIDKYRAILALGTNSSYQHCVDTVGFVASSGLDLSSWKLAITGAEPVRWETMRAFGDKFGRCGFDMNAFHPGFGMAEATLVITGGRFARGPRLHRADSAALRRDIVAGSDVAEALTHVGCGRAMPGEEVAIVDPVSLVRKTNLAVGEVWVKGKNVARGYWKNPKATNNSFCGLIKGETDANWLRTGDLGYLEDDGELFITGRLKDMIIVRGENHYPQDIEYTAEKAATSLRKDYGAAFSVVCGGSEFVVLVYEVKRSMMDRLDDAEVCRDIRQAVLREHGISLHDCVLVKAGTVPKTTSGKIRRSRVSELWRHGLLVPVSL